MMNEKMTLEQGMIKVDEDCVIVRITDGTAICCCDGSYSIGHVISTRPYRVRWDDESTYSNDAEIAAAVNDNDEPEWCLPPRPFDEYEIGPDGPFDFVIRN